MQDLAFSKIWRFPRFGILQDVAFSRLWQSPGPGCCRNWAQRRRKRSVAADAKSWLLLGTKFRMGAKGPECARAARPCRWAGVIF